MCNKLILERSLVCGLALQNIVSYGIRPTDKHRTHWMASEFSAFRCVILSKQFEISEDWPLHHTWPMYIHVPTSIAAVLSKLLPAKKSISLIFSNNPQTSVMVIAKLPFLIVISYAKYCQWDNQVHQSLAIPSWSSPTSKVWLCYETEVPACATTRDKLNMMHMRHDNVHL